MAGAKTEFNFAEWLSDSSLLLNTKTTLESQDLMDERSLAALTESDLVALDLTVGQRGLLCATVTALQDLHTAAAHTGTQGWKATLKSLAQDEELNNLLKDMWSTELTDLLSTGAAAPTDGGRPPCGITGTKGEGPLLIPDFIAQPKGAYIGEIPMQ